ncbi:MAG: sugar phosphate isomerase/epimerase, partial [Maribacter sp.]|nr:sugar phosphate isomerase/epimerase [Maribacter sp.]
MNFGVSTWLWTSPFTTESIGLFPRIRDMGFSHVEIPVENVDQIDPKIVAVALKDHGLLPVVCGAWGPSRDLTSDDPKVRQVCIDYIYR